MSKRIQSKIAQARRRLTLRYFLALLAWTLTAALIGGCVALLAAGFLGRSVSTIEVLEVAVAGGLALAAILVVVRGRNDLEAAVELDRAFRLKERISTLVALDEQARDAPAGRALLTDVESKIGDLVVAERIGFRLPRHGWVPVLPLIGLLLLGYFGPFGWFEQAEANTTSAEQRERIEKEAQLLGKRLAERRDALTEKGALDEGLEELTHDIEKVSRELALDKKMEVKEAVLKLSDLAKKIEQRLKDLDALDQMKRNLAKMSNLKDGPGRQLSQALKDGDFQEAARQLRKLQEQLKDGNMDDKDRQKLAEQLNRLAQQLAQKSRKAQQLQELAQQLQQKIEEQGLSQRQREQLEQQLEQIRNALAQEVRLTKPLGDLAQKLGQCSKCLNGQNGMDDLQQALAEAQELFDQLSRDDTARQTLDEMLADLDQCRNGMCQGNGQGNGLGRGNGRGDRPEAEDETRSRFSRALVKSGTGEATIVGKVKGGEFRGDSMLEIRAAAEAAARAADDSVTRQKIPREYRQHTQDYFDRLHGTLDE